jgi:hypothetical protein
MEAHEVRVVTAVAIPQRVMPGQQFDQFAIQAVAVNLEIAPVTKPERSHGQRFSAPGRSDHRLGRVGA